MHVKYHTGFDNGSPEYVKMPQIFIAPLLDISSSSYYLRAERRLEMSRSAAGLLPVSVAPAPCPYLGLRSPLDRSPSDGEREKRKAVLREKCRLDLTFREIVAFWVAAYVFELDFIFRFCVRSLALRSSDYSYRGMSGMQRCRWLAKAVAIAGTKGRLDEGGSPC